MARKNVLKAARLLSRNARSSSQQSFVSARQFVVAQPRVSPFHATPIIIPRLFSTSSRALKGLSPESENPMPKEAEQGAPATAATEISLELYHQVSDDYLDNILAKLEHLQEEREGVDVEFSAGVLTLHFPPIGTYVLNKQPPNKQIWLSSPISGPKRYDWVVTGEGQNEKEGGGQGDWVYLRDGSNLNEVFIKELQIDLTE